jgi:type IV secretory pathway VirB2 component (pilin)
MDVTTEVGRVGRRADNSEWMDHAVRVGLVSYGVVHLVLAWLSLQLALGGSSGKADQQGALQELAQNPVGRISLWLVGIGFVALVVWQLMEAAWGHREEDGAKRAFKRIGSLAKVAIYAALALTSFKTAAHGRSGSSGGTDGITAKVMQLPAGPLLVALIGAVIVGVAGFLVWQGWSEKFRKRLTGQGQTGKDGSAYVLLGKVGYVAKGVALAIVGLLFVYAALTHDPDKSGGLDQALHKLLQQPFGPVALVAVAVGFGCYGLFCFAWARHLER